MDFNTIKYVLDFSNALETRSRLSFQNMLKLTSKLNVIYKEEQSKLPYHINVIDELHPDENAHSRIFAQLLRFKENTTYPFLVSFFNKLCKFDIQVDTPIVRKVDSNGRIDIPIFDKRYVVLIENKVTDKAIDQNTSQGGQLARYIESIIIRNRKKKEDIYIIYTPKYTRQPTDDAWINKDGHCYKEEFKKRFCSASYRDDIYPWLVNEVLPNIAITNTYLHSAVQQYIDHLEGLFDIRKINETMNMRLQDFLKKELDIENQTPREALEILSEKEHELNNVLKQIQVLKSSYTNEIKEFLKIEFSEWKYLLKKDFPNLEIIEDKFQLKNYIINIGIKFSIRENDYSVVLESNISNLYIGIGRHFASNEKHQETPLLQQIMDQNLLEEPEDYWYGWKYVQQKEAYTSFKDLINQIIQATKTV